jgi:glycosyltransferase 2 family protein
VRRVRLRPGVVFGTNLAVAAGLLTWALAAYGRPALDVLAARPSPALLVAFLAAVAAAFAAFALRWGIVLRGLGCVTGPGRLVVYRAAGQSVSAIVPSAKLGGEPVRAWLLLRHAVPAASAIASVAVDRTLDLGAGAAFTCVFATVLFQRGVPALEGAFVTVMVGAAALALGITVTVRRLRRGDGVVTAVARVTGLDRLDVVRRQMDVLAAAESGAARLIGEPRRLAVAFAIGVGGHAVVLLEYWLLLSAFGLPATPVAVVAAIFATGAAHSLPVPAGVGVLEGAQMLFFGALGHPPEVGLAVGLAVRLRELVWTIPGLVYLAAGGVARSLLREAAA